MDHFSPARIHLHSHLVARHATTNLARVLGVPYSMRPALSMEQANALLGARTRAQEITEGIACKAAFRRYGDEHPIQDPIPFQDENEDPVRVYKNLRKLVEFERKQIETESFIIQELEQITAAVRQLQHDAQQAQAAQAQFNAQAQVPDYFNGIPDPFYIDNSMVDVMNWEPSVVIDLALVERIAERVFNLYERMAADVFGEWKQSQLYNDTWIWPECPIFYDWLKQVVELGLSIYALSPTSVYTDRVLTNIFNDTFLLRSLSSRFIVYCPRQQRHNAGIEFRHLLGEFFDPETTPVISVVNEEQVQSSFTRPKGSGSCANVANNVGQVVHEGATNLAVRFENLRIGKPERSQNRRTSSGDTNGQGRVTVCRQYYWLLCEMNVHVRRWKTVKVIALSPPLVIGANCSQGEASMASIQFQNAGFNRQRGHFLAPRELDCETVVDSLNWLTMARLQKPFSEVNRQCLLAELRRVASPNGKVTLEQMSPASPHPTIPSFFEFFNGFMELVMQHFRELWDNGLVMGWITREHLQTFLQPCAIGTVIIRPAFSVKKAVTISWASSGRIVHSLDPWSDHDLRAKALVPRIEELSSQIRFSCIYPDYPAWMLRAPQNAPPSPPPSPPMEDDGNVSPPVRRPPGYVIVMPMLVYPSQRALSE